MGGVENIFHAQMDVKICSKYFGLVPYQNPHLTLRLDQNHTSI